MKKINEQATQIFCGLLKKLNSRQHLQLVSDGFMPLIMERLEENISTPWSLATTYSLAHYYEQNGDLMRDPEMVFIVVDNRFDEKDMQAIGIYPQTFQQDNLGLYEESARIENGELTKYIKVWQSAHTSFANIWLKNLQQQRFLTCSR
jgi:hypothetical protein